MAGPITWRNVDAPSGAEAFRAMAGAQNTLNGAFDAFGNIIRQREAVDAANVATMSENGKQAFLDQLATAKTPEELAAMQRSGLVDELRANLSPQARAATRNADEARLTSLRQQTIAGDQFNDQALEREQRPIKDAIISLATQNKGPEALAMIQANPNLRNAAELHKAVLNGERDFTRFGWEGQRAGFAVNADARASSADTRATASHNLSMQTQQLALTEAQQKAKDAETSRTLQTNLGQLSAAHQASTADARAVISAEARSLGLAVNSDGTLNMSALDSKQRTRLEDSLKAKGLPALQVMERGDTAAKAAYMEGLRKSGAYTPAQIQAVEASADKAFDSTSPASIGIDKETRAASRAAQDALEERQKMQNGEVATPETRDSLLKNLEPIVDSYADKGSARHRSYLAQLAKFIETGGIEVPQEDGTKQRVLPSEAALRGLMRQIERDNMVTQWLPGSNSGHDNDLSDVFDKWTKAAANRQGASNAVAAFNRKNLQKAVKPTDK